MKYSVLVLHALAWRLASAQAAGDVPTAVTVVAADPITQTSTTTTSSPSPAPPAATTSNGPVTSAPSSSTTTSVIPLPSVPACELSCLTNAVPDLFSKPADSCNRLPDLLPIAAQCAEGTCSLPPAATVMLSSAVSSWCTTQARVLGFSLIQATSVQSSAQTQTTTSPSTTTESQFASPGMATAAVTYDGSSANSTTSPAPESSSHNLTNSSAIAVGVGVGVGIPLLGAIAALLFFWNRRRRNQQNGRNQGPYGPLHTSEKNSLEARDGGATSRSMPPQQLHDLPNDAQSPFLSTPLPAPTPMGAGATGYRDHDDERQPPHLPAAAPMTAWHDDDDDDDDDMMNDDLRRGPQSLAAHHDIYSPPSPLPTLTTPSAVSPQLPPARLSTTTPIAAARDAPRGHFDNADEPPSPVSPMTPTEGGGGRDSRPGSMDFGPSREGSRRA